VLPRLAEAGELRITLLRAGGASIAFQIGLLDEVDGYGFLATAFDRVFDRYSPGLRLLLEAIEWARSNGCSTFDFFQGDQGYKRRFSNDVLDLSDVILFPADATGRLHEGLFRGLRSWQRWRSDRRSARHR
jgi:CelD/BcsL family acetyltransferase involved in cellulose biosynthesis